MSILTQHFAGANGDLPENLYMAPPSKNGFGLYSGTLRARLGEGGPIVGKMTWNAHDWPDSLKDNEEIQTDGPPGMIHSISVHPDYRRRGIGRAMIEHAHSRPEYVYKPTNAGHRTDPGEGLARALSPDVSERSEGHGEDGSYHDFEWSYINHGNEPPKPHTSALLRHFAALDIPKHKVIEPEEGEDHVKIYRGLFLGGGKKIEYPHLGDWAKPADRPALDPYDPDSVLARARLRGREHGSAEEYPNAPLSGTHWTTDKQIAHDFAMGQATNLEHQRRADTKNDDHYGVVLEARVKPGSVKHDAFSTGFNEKEIDHFPKREDVHSVHVHVHRLDQHRPDVYGNERDQQVRQLRHERGAPVRRTYEGDRHGTHVHSFEIPQSTWRTAFHKVASWDDEDKGDRDRDEHGNCYYYPDHDHEHEDVGNHSIECPYSSTHTDWDREYKHVGDTLHRGYTTELPDEVHKVVHDETKPVHERARALANHLNGFHGMHWSDDEDQATEYAGRGNLTFATSVKIHVHKPAREHIETDPETLHERNVYGRGEHDDGEVPLKDGAPVHVKGISWLKQDHRSKYNPHLPESWHHHEFADEPVHHTALRKVAERNTVCSQGHVHWGEHGAAGLLIRHTDPEGNRHYLLQHRGENVDHPNTWSIPGGALKKGESPLEGAHREAIEEMGEMPALSHHDTQTADHGGWKYHTVVVNSPTRFVPEGGGSHDHEQQNAAWFSESEIDDLDLHPGFAKTWPTHRRTAKAANSWSPEHGTTRDKTPMGATDAKQFRRDYRMTSVGPTPRHFGHDTLWEIGGGGTAPDPADLHGPGQHVTLPTHVPLVSTQPEWDAAKVEKMRKADREDLNASGRPQVFYDHNDDTMAVLDGHHRILADRLDGQDSAVQLWTSRDVKEGQAPKFSVLLQHFANAEPYLHASNVLFEPGDHVHPTKTTGLKSLYSEHNDHHSQDHVYLYRASEVPEHFRLQGGAVYEVDPHQDVEPDPEPSSKHGGKPMPGAYRTKGPATVTKMVSNNWRDPAESIPEELRGSGWTPTEQPRAQHFADAEIRANVARGGHHGEDGAQALLRRGVAADERRATARRQEALDDAQAQADTRGVRRGARRVASPDPAVGRDDAREPRRSDEGVGAPRLVSWDSAAIKAHQKMDRKMRQRVDDKIAAIARGDDNLQTKAMQGNMSAWQETRVNRKYRILHQDNDDGSLHIGHVGPHDLDRATRRLSARSQPTHPKAHQHESLLREHVEQMHPDLHATKGHKSSTALDLLHRVEHRITDNAGVGSEGTGHQQSLTMHEHHPLIDPTRRLVHRLADESIE